MRAYEAGQITEETAVLYCSNKTKFRRDLDALQKVMGNAQDDGPSGLKLNVARSERAKPAPVMPRPVMPRPVVKTGATPA